jgi:hypothetical protein
MPKRKYDLTELNTGKENSIPYIKSESNLRKTDSRLTIAIFRKLADAVLGKLSSLA